MKRAHETTTTTAVAKKRGRMAADIVQMYLGLYEEAILEAEDNISSHPTVFIHDYISAAEHWRDLLEDGAPEPERISLLISRNRELNNAARSAWKKRYDEMQAPSSVDYFFVRPTGYEEHKGMKTPVGQIGLLSHIAGRPKLVEELQAWLDRRTAFHYDKLTDLQRLALAHYSFSGYKEVWEAFEKDEVSSNKTASQIAKVFEDVRADPDHSSLPLGTCLFEGQGHHPGEDDILRLKLTDDQLPYSMATAQHITRAQRGDQLRHHVHGLPRPRGRHRKMAFAPARL